MVARLTKGVAFLNLLIVLAAVIVSAQTALAQNFITVDYPGAPTGISLNRINNKAVMVGSYLDAQDVGHGFVLQNGVFTIIDFPGAYETFAHGINDNGDVVGSYDYNGIYEYGFLLSNGVYTAIDVPNSLSSWAFGINNVGQIVGGYDDLNNNQHGFLLSAGAYSTIDYPGSVVSEVDSINNAGAMVGYYTNADFTPHGFLLQNGTPITIDYPGAAGTEAYGINDGGQIVGWYDLSLHGNIQAFEYNPNSNPNFTTINFPGANSSVRGINDAGQLVGGYYDGANLEHGVVSAVGPFAYVANLGSDTVSMIDIPTSLPVTTIHVGSEPWGVAISPNGKQVYASNYIGNSVSVIDTASNTVVATIPGLSSPRSVAFTPPDGTWVYVANPGSNNVSVIDTALQTVVATVPVPDAIGVAMALTSNGTFAYVTNANGSVSVIAVGSNPTVVQTINVGSLPVGVAVTPNSSLAYVANSGSNNISVISVASNTVTATIPVGTNPYGVAFTPDSSFAYVANSGSNTVSVIDTATNSVVKTVSGFNMPYYVALSTDGAFAYVTNIFANYVSVIDTASNTIMSTAAVGSSPYGVAIASAPQTELQITQPLSPTQPNNFNFGTNNYQVQYPPGTQFSNVTMTVTEVPITQAQFQQDVAGTAFAGAACIVYAGAGGNCVDHQVTCNPSPCPTASEIDVQTSFATSQSIINPGYLTSPIGLDQWNNIFSGYFGIGPLITVKGKTTGFSEFVAADLGAGNPQGLAQFQIVNPQLPATFPPGSTIPVEIQLASVVNGKPVTDAQVDISVVMIADANGNPTQQVVLSATNAFTQPRSGVYDYVIQATQYALGTYKVTIYGNAFSAYQGQFEIVVQGAVAQAKPTNLSFGNQYVGTTSSALRDSLFNVGSATVTVRSVQTTGDFQIQTNHCTKGVKPKTHCDVYVTFTPTASGTRTGFLNYTDNAQESPQTVALSGVGTATRPTTSTLSSSPNPSAYGQGVRFTAVVTSSAGAPPDGETVSFMKGATLLGTGTLSGGSASFTTSALPVGTNSITAVYGGDPNFAGSKSKAVSQVVNKATTTTTLTSSLNPSNFGQSVTFTATVTPQFGGNVTGTVTFYDGTTLLKTVALSGGASKFTTSALTAGTHSVKATYNGSTSFSGSSASLTQTVN